MADNTLPGLPQIRNLVAAGPDLLRGLVEQTVNARGGHLMTPRSQNSPYRPASRDGA